MPDSYLHPMGVYAIVLNHKWMTGATKRNIPSNSTQIYLGTFISETTRNIILAVTLCTPAVTVCTKCKKHYKNVVIMKYFSY